MIRIAYVSAFAALAIGAGVSTAQAGFDCSKFARNDDGSWRVLQPLQIRTAHGLIDFTPDETYTEGHEKLGLDMAKLLNANCAKK
jgi:hypothetical protein